MNRLLLLFALATTVGACSRASPGPSPAPAPQEAAPAEAAATPPARAETPPEPAAAPPSPDELCSLGAFEQWTACEGQRVRLAGNNPEFVQQHPLLTGGPVDPEHPVEQGYMDVADAGQIIVLTREPIRCRSAMVATGTLRRIEAKVDKAVKSKVTYGNWYLEDATVECGTGGPS